MFSIKYQWLFYFEVGVYGAFNKLCIPKIMQKQVTIISDNERINRKEGYLLILTFLNKSQNLQSYWCLKKYFRVL